MGTLLKKIYFSREYKHGTKFKSTKRHKGESGSSLLIQVLPALWVYHDLFNMLFLDGHLGCF